MVDSDLGVTFPSGPVTRGLDPHAFLADSIRIFAVKSSGRRWDLGHKRKWSRLKTKSTRILLTKSFITISPFLWSKSLDPNSKVEVWTRRLESVHSELKEGHVPSTTTEGRSTDPPNFLFGDFRGS